MIFLDGILSIFDVSLISPKNASFLCALYGNVTVFFYFDPKYTVQDPFSNKQVCPDFINVLIKITCCINLLPKTHCLTLQ